MFCPSTIDRHQTVRKLQGTLDKRHLGSGETPDLLEILAQSPAASAAYVRVEDTLARGQLSERQREQIALAVAEINGSAYWLKIHSLRGRLAGLTEEEIQAARRAAARDPKVDQMLRFTQSMVLQRGEISEADLSALQAAGFAEAEVVEIVANIALNVFTNYLNILAKA